MNAQEQSRQPKGISARSFLLFTTVGLALLFLLGVIVSPEAAPTWSVFGKYIFEFLVKVVYAGGIGALSFGVFWTQILDCKLFLGTIREKFANNNNDSYAIIAVTFLLGLPAVFLLFSGGDTIQQFVAATSTKGAVGIAIGMVFTFLAARLFGVSNLDDFRCWVETKDNNNYVILVCAIFLSTVAVSQ